MKNILLIIALLYTLTISADTVIKNFLPEAYYGMEEGRTSWWLQHDEYWSFTNDMSANGNYALKFTCTNAAALSSTVKAFAGDDSYTGSRVNLEPGTYTLNMKLWVDADYEGTGFNLIIKEGWYKQSFNFSEYETGQWVEVSKNISIDEEVSNSTLLFSVSANQVGNGNFYIDDLQLLREVEEIIYVPYTSSVTSSGASCLTLAQGDYKMNLMVYIENETTIEHFYTIIEEPYTAIKWHISTLEKEKWVELENTFTLNANATESPLEIKVPSNPDHGGGYGALYIDDIAFTKTIANNIDHVAETAVKIYPNPASTSINIETSVGSCITIYNILGKIEKQVTTTALYTDIATDNLSAGIYLVHLVHDGKQQQETLLIK